MDFTIHSEEDPLDSDNSPHRTSTGDQPWPAVSCSEAFAFTHLRFPATGVSKHIYNLSRAYQLLLQLGWLMLVGLSMKQGTSWRLCGFGSGGEFGINLDVCRALVRFAFDSMYRM